MGISESLVTKQLDSDEIDLGRVLGILIDNRWTIITITILFACIGIAYSALSTPIYKADALLQVETKTSGLPALGEMGDLFAQESSATTEIEIIKSRMIIGKSVDKLNLTTVAEPIYIPLVGKGLARIGGNEIKIDIARFEIPPESNEKKFIIEITKPDKGEYNLLDGHGNLILTGYADKLSKKDGYSLYVTSLTGVEGSSFTIKKQTRLDAIQSLQNDLFISERGKQTGILQLSLKGEDRNEIVAVLNDITNNYFLQNVERNSAEAENSLKFLRKHLPVIKAELITSEDKLNRFRQENESIDLGLEAKATLDVMVKLEAQLNELTFKESEISQRFTKEHPSYNALLEKRETLLGEKARLNRQVQKLPKTQREILRMTRDVEVNQQIYVQLLNKVQELNIIKASTVGNVRILDHAQSYSQPVKPNKIVLVTLITLFGVLLSVFIIFLKSIFNRGVESPDEIEELGIPVYASVPMSDWQANLEKKQNKSFNKRVLPINETLLAVSNPADLSIEALRSLRTSLHFAMMEAKNNILMISGPSPGIGKSFVSTNVAATIAKTGQKVLIIDADMRKGRMEKQLSIKNTSGLSEFLSGQIEYSDLIKKTDVENLWFVNRGEIPPNPSELLMHPRFTDLMKLVSSEYDIVIVDTPPILAVTDPAIVGAHVGTTLLVGRFAQNTAKEIIITKQRFEQNGIEVKGFILNAVMRKASNKYSGNYGYYNYSYESTKES